MTHHDHAGPTARVRLAWLVVGLLATSAWLLMQCPVGHAH